MLKTFALSLFIMVLATVSFAKETTKRKPASSATCTNPNSEGFALPLKFTYTTSEDEKTVTLSDIESTKDASAIDFSACKRATLVRTAYGFGENCNLRTLSFDAGNIVSINNTDGNFLKYSCR